MAEVQRLRAEVRRLSNENARLRRAVRLCSGDAVNLDDVVWNVIAPVGSEVLIDAAATVVFAHGDGLDGREISERIAALVPGARVGPVVR